MNQIVYRGSNTFGLLGIAFVVLKLVGVINWSWWWVTIPFWAPIGLLAIFLIIIAIILSLKEKYEK